MTCGQTFAPDATMNLARFNFPKRVAGVGNVFILRAAKSKADSSFNRVGNAPRVVRC